eukprot:1140026-Pelagomonas_calceolata.AAC.4
MMQFSYAWTRTGEKWAADSHTSYMNIGGHVLNMRETILCQPRGRVCVRKYQIHPMLPSLSVSMVPLSSAQSACTYTFFCTLQTAGLPAYASGP